jgi:flavin reductase (DIM6/NTAB) family NADH-FMN oxidoreductase RutF
MISVRILTGNIVESDHSPRRRGTICGATMPKGKIDFPVAKVRRYLEPGPIVLVSSAWRGETNIMTMGWHTVMEFTPSLVGCIIAAGNHSFDLIRRSNECVINVPTTALTDAVVGIGNCSGATVRKFDKFGLTAEPGHSVKAPLIAECHANFECKLNDDSLVERYNFFIFEVVKAHVARRPKYPQTLHYTGDGVFMVAGRIISRRGHFKPEML